MDVHIRYSRRTQDPEILELEAEEKTKKEAEANLKKVISFKGAQIRQFEANILQEIETLIKLEFIKVDKIK